MNRKDYINEKGHNFTHKLMLKLIHGKFTIVSGTFLHEINIVQYRHFYAKKKYCYISESDRGN